MKTVSYLILVAALEMTCSAVYAEPAPDASLYPKGSQRAFERGVANSLVANFYSNADKDLIASDVLDQHNHYVLGYFYFKSGERAKAKQMFEQSIVDGTFVPESHYMLAVMMNQDYTAAGGHGDLSPAYAHIEKAIAADPKYSSPYYLRGILRWKANQPTEALADLTKASSLTPATCYRIHDPKEIDDVWRNPVTKEVIPGLKTVQENCVAAHKMGATIQKLPPK